MIARTFIHAIRYHIGLDSASTQVAVGEQNCIREWAANRNCLVELGVFEGRTTRILGDVMNPLGKLYAVDPFFSGRLGLCWGKSIAIREAAKSKCFDRIEFIPHLSHEAIRMIEGNFDFVFFDGDHSLSGIERDWLEWSARILPGGIATLHDTRAFDPCSRTGVLGSVAYFDAVIRHDSRFRLVDQVDSLSVLERISA